MHATPYLHSLIVGSCMHKGMQPRLSFSTEAEDLFHDDGFSPMWVASTLRPANYISYVHAQVHACTTKVRGIYLWMRYSVQ